MYTDEQEKLIERFTEHTSEIWRKWSKAAQLNSPPGIRLEDIYRKLYSTLVPNEPLLPTCWSHRMTVVSQRGDGMLETNETLFMPSAEKEYTYELLVAGIAYVKTSESDRDPEDSPWEFIIYAPTKEALEHTIEVLSQLIPPMPEIKPASYTESEEKPEREQIEETKKSVHPKLIITMTPDTKGELAALKEYLEDLPGIANLEYEFSYNLAECEYDYEVVHFDFKNCSFKILPDNDTNNYLWNFYVLSGEYSDDIVTELADYCELFGEK